MLLSRRRPGLTMLLAGLLSCFLVVPGRVSATTGPTPGKLLPPSPYKVSNQTAHLYTGRYLLQSAARATRLSRGAMVIEINGQGFLYGLVQFYGYDQRGQQTSWVGTLYNFHQAAQQVMIIDIVGPAGKPLLARLFVTRSRQCDLIGQIALPAGRYAISWHKLPQQ